MFDNIGRKIKDVAQIVTWIGIVASIIGGIIITSTLKSPIGILVMIVGPLISWLSSLTLYGLGQLIENTDIIAGKMHPCAQDDGSCVQTRDDTAIAAKTATINDLRKKGLITEEEYNQKMESLK